MSHELALTIPSLRERCFVAVSKPSKTEESLYKFCNIRFQDSPTKMFLGLPHFAVDLDSFVADGYNFEYESHPSHLKLY